MDYPLQGYPYGYGYVVGGGLVGLFVCLDIWCFGCLVILLGAGCDVSHIDFLGNVTCVIDRGRGVCGTILLWAGSPPDDRR